MLTESDVRPQHDFEIENIVDGKCDIIFYDNIQEIDVEIDGQINKKYKYNLYRLTTNYRENLESDLQNDSSKLAEYKQTAVNKEYNSLAEEIRAKRNKLLAESDSEMCIDRLGLSIPSGATFTAWLSFLKKLGSTITGEMATYRTNLRNITEQPNFPYEVEWPKKPGSGD